MDNKNEFKPYIPADKINRYTYRFSPLYSALPMHTWDC